ncbi:malonate decarboxylase holo-[acyl-carrier-protein] synthase [Variovorax sp. J2P1-59]|uniref:malonate decarboxylase holo-[acyl-carrier-protein] synthase n=1 Tax=Variovorax flavidus TaxID=3053501 RepID=UPI002576E806|nr:malonate decarboxylase holo-[acyl-carrier-protein] synthase [Variovorax sp. J2P1-59]MDM0075431.1 malonate decarboxylase holo-[acyl-carrier-protein] synthase [Variovorax sp. J2P1-59]
MTARAGIMEALRRHRLVRLTREGWATVLARPWDAPARGCLAHWAEHGLPLVVTRQSPEAGDLIALGLPAPTRWERRRIAVHVSRSALLCFEDFPGLAEVLPLLPAAARTSVCDLQDGLKARGASARVHGSYGWQVLSGLDHVRADSDLDVCVQVEDAAHADGVAHQLGLHAMARPRLDGELMFPDGAAVAWREWSDWRAARTRAVMVKRLTGAVLWRDATSLAALAA